MRGPVLDARGVALAGHGSGSIRSREGSFCARCVSVDTLTPLVRTGLFVLLTLSGAACSAAVSSSDDDGASSNSDSEAELRRRRRDAGGADAVTKDVVATVESTDPFDPSSCLGAPMSVAEAAARFAPGQTSALAGYFRKSFRSRHCEPLTGCTEWQTADRLNDMQQGAHDWLDCVTHYRFTNAVPSWGFVNLEIEPAHATEVKARMLFNMGENLNTGSSLFGFQCDVPTRGACGRWSTPRDAETIVSCEGLHIDKTQFDDAAVVLTNHCVRASFKTPAPPPHPTSAWGEGELVLYGVFGVTQPPVP